MTIALQAVYRYWVAVLVVAIIVQIGAAGWGVFSADQKVGAGHKEITKTQFDHGFNFHDGFGYIIFFASILLFLFALGARLGRKRVLMVLGVPLLVLLQIALAIIGEKTPAVGVLHPINAFIVLGLVGSLAHGAWRGDRSVTVA